jgi:hypothetical protein
MPQQDEMRQRSIKVALSFQQHQKESGKARVTAAVRNYVQLSRLSSLSHAIRLANMTVSALVALLPLDTTTTSSHGR